MNWKSKLYRAVLGALFLAVIGVCICIEAENVRSHREVRKIGGTLEDWTLLPEGGQPRKIQDPEKINLPGVKRFSIRTKLPEDFARSQELVFWSYNSVVEVQLGRDVIYRWDNRGNEAFGHSVSSRWNILAIPASSAGKSLTICLEIPYDMPVHNFTEGIHYGSVKQAEHWLKRNFGFALAGDTLIFLAGVFCTIITFFQKGDKNFKRMQFSFYFTMMLLAIWLRMGTVGMPLHLCSYFMRDALGFLAFLFLPVTLFLYVKYRLDGMKFWQNICSLFVLISLINFVTVTILHLLQIKDLIESFIPGQILLMIAVAFMFGAVGYTAIKKKAYFWRAELVLEVLLLFAALSEFIGFYSDNSLPVGNVVRVGVLIFAVGTCCRDIIYIRRVYEKQKQINEEHRQVQMHLLTSQIQPHFIGNTLGAIRMLIKEDPDLAYDMLYDFSKYIRQNVNMRDYYQKIRFTEELDYVKTYLKLEKLRYGDRLAVTYDIETDDFWILPLTVQPFVENSVKHGLFPLKQGGEIKITAHRQRDFYEIEIADNGVGFKKEEALARMNAGKAVGMRSAIVRLESQMHAECFFDSHTGEEYHGTVVRIRLPWNECMEGTADEDNFSR